MDDKYTNADVFRLMLNGMKIDHERIADENIRALIKIRNKAYDVAREADKEISNLISDEDKKLAKSKINYSEYPSYW